MERRAVVQSVVPGLAIVGNRCLVGVKRRAVMTVVFCSRGKTAMRGGRARAGAAARRRVVVLPRGRHWREAQRMSRACRVWRDECGRIGYLR